MWRAAPVLTFPPLLRRKWGKECGGWDVISTPGRTPSQCANTLIHTVCTVSARSKITLWRACSRLLCLCTECQVLGKVFCSVLLSRFHFIAVLSMQGAEFMHWSSGAGGGVVVCIVVMPGGAPSSGSGALPRSVHCTGWCRPQAARAPVLLRPSQG